MADATMPYPLQWPAGRARKPVAQRKRAPFRRGVGDAAKPVNLATARNRLQYELDQLGARYAVLSTNVELRIDGHPRGGMAEPADTGVALYFQLAGKPHCMPCDTYDRVADIAAVAAHIEATRRIERHGVATVAEMFSGFAALPSPSDARPWRQVLELHNLPIAGLTGVEAAYRRLARERHPDAGGSDAMMAELNAARAAARKELGDG